MPGTWGLVSMSLLQKTKHALRCLSLRGDNLLESPRTAIAHIEFTSGCNLRCVFCGINQPGYKVSNLEVGIIDQFIHLLSKRAPKVISVNGHGETTTFKNWHLHCDKMIKRGMPLHITSNFSKTFSYTELDTMSHFKSIEISCDTFRPELFSRLRRGAQLEILIQNLKRLREITTRENRKLPEISFSCVVSDVNVLDMPRYVRFGIELGVIHFNFCNLTSYPSVKGDPTPRHISEMPVPLLEKVEQSLTEAFEFLKSKEISYFVQQGLLDTLQQRITNARQSPQADLSERHTPAPDTEETDNPPAQVHRYSSLRPGNLTRDCIDPWNFIMVQSNREISPCCWHRPIQVFNNQSNTCDPFNNTQVKRLRRQLLTGDLAQDCLDCPSRGWTQTSVLKKKVWDYLHPGFHQFQLKAAPEIKPERLTRFKVEFMQGWHDHEYNRLIRNPERQNWRWTSEQALCRLENPHKEALLMLHASVNKSIFDDQKILLKLKDTLLDEFVPAGDEIFKEYHLPLQLMGDDPTLMLSIETDHCFIPSRLDAAATDSRQLGVQVFDLFFGEIST